jgi:uncharacterized protein
MTSAFADASFYIALASPRDQKHAVASEFAGTFTGRVVTTECVLTEVGNYLSHPAHRLKFLELVARLRADRETTIVPSSSVLWDRGLEFYARRADKQWSLTDCISIVVMKELGLTDALTADRDFEQAGFNVLLK